MVTRVLDRIVLYNSVVIVAVLLLLPFHAFFTTLIGSNTGHLDLVRIWKELIIVALFPGSIWLMLKDESLKNWFFHNWLPRLILIYLTLQVVLGVVALRTYQVTASALIYGLLANLRFLGFFLIIYVASTKSSYLKRNWKTIIIIPAVAVIVFGIMQYFVLPHDFLKHFGYGPNTIPAFQTVDNKLDYQRIQSTLRGANPLGAYLVLMLPLLLVLKRRKVALGLLSLALIALLCTYSRSALIGALLTLAVYVYLSLPTTKLRKQLAGLLAILVLVTGATVVGLRHNRLVQNAVFHTDNTSQSAESSNTGRARALEVGLSDVTHEPLGRGPGTAGPASLRNNKQARVAENYYLQIGQEVGWLGLVLFVAITSMVGYELWKRRHDNLCRALVASLIGISFINLLSHAWVDDTLGLMWWGIAGIALPSVILNNKRKYYESR